MKDLLLKYYRKIHEIKKYSRLNEESNQIGTTLPPLHSAKLFLDFAEYILNYPIEQQSLVNTIFCKNFEAPHECKSLSLSSEHIHVVVPFISHREVTLIYKMLCDNSTKLQTKTFNTIQKMKPTSANYMLWVAPTNSFDAYLMRTLGYCCLGLDELLNLAIYALTGIMEETSLPYITLLEKFYGKFPNISNQEDTSTKDYIDFFNRITTLTNIVISAITSEKPAIDFLEYTLHFVKGSASVWQSETYIYANTQIPKPFFNVFDSIDADEFVRQIRIK